MPFTSSQTYSFTGTNWNEKPGVYGIMNAKRQMIYVGMTDNFKRRMAEHQADKTHCMHRYGPALVYADLVEGLVARSLREQALIREYNPPCNQR